MTFPKFLLVLVAATVFSVPAFGDSITLTLLNPNQSIAAGQTGEFNATVTAASGNTGLIFLNSDSFSVSGPFNLDDSDYFNNFPQFLAPGASFTGALFTLTDTATSGTSAYSGSFSVLGGSDGNANSLLATGTFPRTINSVTPEPASLLLLATGMSTLVAFRKRRS